MASEITSLPGSDYPLNLPFAGLRSHKGALQKYKNTFDAIEKDLCHPSGHPDIAVPIRDLYGGPEKEVQKRNVKTEPQLTQWLEIKKRQNLNDNDLMVPKQQLKCRFIYIFGETSRSRLRVSRSMLTKIFTFHAVMPAYLDFVFVFGRQEKPRDFNFSGFRGHMSLSQHTPTQEHRIEASHGNALSEIEEKYYQMCFNLKSALLKTNTWEKPPEALPRTGAIGNFLSECEQEWTIRQVAIYHRFNAVTGRTLWILTKGGLDLKERFKDLTSKDALPAGNSFDTPLECFRASLATQVMYCQWSTEDWRDYLRWLENVIEEKSIMAVLGPRDKGTAHRKYVPNDIQDLQDWKDRVSEVTMSIKTNIAVIRALRRFYERFSQHKAFALGGEGISCMKDTFTDLDEIIEELEMHLIRSELLEEVIQDRKKLILQHLQGQATERTEQLSHNMEREAIVMRIITSVTLLYLPATFASTFFSTDIVKYQVSNSGDNANGSFSPVALTRWLQVTIPLTCVTICGSWVAYRLSEQTKYKHKHKEGSDEVRLSESWSAHVHKARAKARTCWNMEKKKLNPS